MVKLLSPAALDSNPLAPAKDVILVVKGTDPLPDGECRALLVGAAGTANLITGAGEIRNDVPLQVGVNPIRVTHVLGGGLAGDIWAMY